MTNLVKFTSRDVFLVQSARRMLLSNKINVVHLPLFLPPLVFSESDRWLWVLLATKDDEQAARHLSFVFVS